MAEFPGGRLVLDVGAGCAELQHCPEVFGEFWVYPVDLGQGVPHSGADSLSGAFGVISESAVAAAEPGRGGQLVDEFVTFGAEGFGEIDVLVDLLDQDQGT